MSIKNKIILRSFAISLAVLTLFVGSPAQTKKVKHSHWNWQKHEAEAIDYAKKYLVSKIELNLPPISFEDWFQQTVGKDAKVEWEINDCGEQTGSLADRGRDFPMCIVTRTQTAEFFYISVNIQFGMFSSGISKEKPFLRDIAVGDLLDGELFYVLSDLPKKIKSNQLKRQYLDPNGGVFVTSAENSAVLKDFTRMWLQTMARNAANKYVAVPQNGGIEISQKVYSMRNVYFNGKNLSFETVKIGGVSFMFEGEFAKLRFDSDGKVLGDNVLQGHLTKFVNGKKTAETDLIFSFYLTSDAG